MERAEFAELKYFVSWFMEKTSFPWSFYIETEPEASATYKPSPAGDS
jgi:hypothetical protein